MTTERLGKYEVRGTLGKGAMGTVYAAWDPIISRQVAIKTVRLPDASDIDAQEELARFKREAQAAGRLTHPNIVGIFDYGETDDVAYIVMEFVDGRTLKSVLDGDERMPVATVVRVMSDLLAGLAYSHERGVVHRDIKPANVMIVGGDGHGSGQAKIADFGIARIESSNLTQAGTIMGTPAYMSPEQFMGQTVDARTDIYSSGVLLFQLLTGERPFEGSMATIMHKALNTQPPKPSELSVTAPRALDAVVARAMARRPEDRYASAAAFAAAITDAVSGKAPVESEESEPGLGLGLGDDFDTESTVVRPAARPKESRATQNRATQNRATQNRATQTGRVAPPVAPAVVERRSKAPLLATVAVVALLAGGGAGAAWYYGLLFPHEPSNAEIAQANPASTGASSTATSTPGPTPTPPAPPTPPVQVVESRAVTPPAQVLETPAVTPPARGEASGAPSPAPRRTDLSQAPPLEPAQVTPPPVVPTAEPRQEATSPVASTASTGPAPSVATVPQVTPSVPAVVTPPAVVASSGPPPVVVSPASGVPVVVPPVTPPPTPAGGTLTSRPVTPPAVVTVPETPVSVTPAQVTPPQVTPPQVTPQVVVAPTQTAALVSPEALRRAVGAAVQGADCAMIGGDLARSGTLSLQGVVGSGGPTQDVLRHVRDAAPNAPLDWSVEEVTGPYCGAINLVRAYGRPFGSVTGGLEVGLRDGRTHLRADDKIDIRAQMAGFAGYLQVDYFSSDGSVLHVQTAGPGTPLAARSAQNYVPGEVAPPFGTDLVIAVASSVPLFAKGQDLSDQAEAYLRQLRTALDAAAKKRAEVAAGAVVVHTSPKS